LLEKTAKSNKQKKSKKRVRFTTPKPKKADKPFPFLALPAELRDFIYELALVEPEGLTLVSKTKSYRRTVGRGVVHKTDASGYSTQEIAEQSGDLVPNLLAVNKQIHAEAIGYLYKQPIVLHDTMALHTFIAAIGTNRLQLTDVIVRGWGYGRGAHKASNVAALTILAGCTNLKSLDLDCNIGWSRTPKQLARQLYRDGHYFLEAYGAANGSKDAALKVLKVGKMNTENGRWHSRYSASQNPSQDSEHNKFIARFEEEMKKLLKVGE